MIAWWPCSTELINFVLREDLRENLKILVFVKILGTLHRVGVGVFCIIYVSLES